MSLWEQRLETNGWTAVWFQTFVNMLTKNKIKTEDFEDQEEFEKEQRECFFDRIDILCFIASIITLLVSAGVSVIQSAADN